MTSERMEKQREGNATGRKIKFKEKQIEGKAKMRKSKGKEK